MCWLTVEKSYEVGRNFGEIVCCSKHRHYQADVRSDSERLKGEQELQEKEKNTVFQARTIPWLRSTIPSLNTNPDSLSSAIRMFWKSQNDTEFMRDAVKAQGAMLVAENTKLAQKMADIQKRVDTIHRSLPEYHFKLSSDIASRFQEFFRCPLDSAHESV